MAPSREYAVLNRKVPFLHMIYDNGYITQDILNHRYEGAGTDSHPYIVTWLADDPRNPMNFRETSKWAINVLATLAALVPALCSSAYSSGLTDLIEEFDVSTEVSLLGSSFFVLGFALGPLLWGAVSEAYGRRNVMLASSVLLTAFSAGAAAAPNMGALVILLFLAGGLGSAAMAVSGGVVADLFPALTRGMAMAAYSGVPFIGGVLGPIIGAVVDVYGGWRWIQGAMAIISAVIALAVFCLLPETYAPVLLDNRAKRLSKATGRVYRSTMAMHGSNERSLGGQLRTILVRPWVLFFCEPIVLLIALYNATVYGILYMSFAAYPIVFQQLRGWSTLDTGLSFIGILVGVLLSIPHIYVSHTRYSRKMARTRHRSTDRLPPEYRLPDAFGASIALPVGLFWFAWTIAPVSIPWIVPILASVPVGYGLFMVSLPCYNYLTDSYTVYAASIMAACMVMVSIFSAVFPLFTDQMYQSLGPRWAASVPAFLALACVPIPFVLYKYGPLIRARCFYAAEADACLDRMLRESYVQVREVQGGQDVGVRSSEI
ncbi:MFS transporter [Aspergillus homomorphus CBS 101889]|uniref:MFS general substrate transporter n=1 Tax=Aspergillus homomorphus (strain CBS 101889) TaxID=1450537 RepID=A0A395I2F0_ASPHC|nr:MFS general substrate transporter [Aspergillus homomorphus CBS 101889]RAL14352.1 MFS general substrate transporter [Aspergillus homomorphus CBS 101889]